VSPPYLLACVNVSPRVLGSCNGMTIRTHLLRHRRHALTRDPETIQVSITGRPAGLLGRFLQADH
jgi:hypothetical protein